MLTARTALVVEDDPDIRRLVCTYLAALGFEPVEARDAEAAIEQLKQCAPALVCLDWMLPVASGYTVCEYMLDTPTLQKTPVLVISARSLPQDRAQAQEVGASGYLTKPFSREAFNAHVQSLLGEQGGDPSDQVPALLK
jgi:DNA-binding response OmpR family regulator